LTAPKKMLFGNARTSTGLLDENIHEIDFATNVPLVLFTRNIFES